jgi:2'-5' RNA ligase
MVAGSDPLSQVRAFFAIDLTSEVRARLARAVSSAESLMAGEPVRWVRRETLHLTLRFLGETPQATLDRVQQAAEERSRSWPAFDLEVRGVGCFPDERRPRVIWAGANEPSGALQTVAEDLEQLARAFGYPAEERAFSAHLTVGRVRDRLSPAGLRRLTDWIQRSASESYGTFAVGSVELLKSDLRPGGPVYTRVATFPLHE